MFLKIEGLSKRYDGSQSETLALNNVSFGIPKGTFLTLLGPSGCGKSTLLSLLAGLDQPTTGRIEMDGTVVYDSERNVLLTPAERNIAMVFQSYAIWPHMSVRGNVDFPLRFGLRGSRLTTSERVEAVDHALRRVRLQKFADRPAPLLSGGQQQRVSLARALAQRPSLLLLDEPLSNLDAYLRERMQREIRSIVTDEHITAVYVTHDQKEALSMSDTIVIMKDGVVQQIGSPKDVYFSPKNYFVAKFMGSPNILEVTVRTLSEDLIFAESELGVLCMSRKTADQDIKIGKRLSAVLKQEDMRVLVESEPRVGANQFELPCIGQVFLGDRVEVICGLREGSLSIYTNARDWAQRETVRFTCDPRRIHYFASS